MERVVLAKLKQATHTRLLSDDGFVSRLHYQATSTIFIFLSLLVGLKQYFGNAIECISEAHIKESLLNTYCWVHSTFSVKSDWNRRVGIAIPYPGVGKHIGNNAD